MHCEILKRLLAFGTGATPHRLLWCKETHSNKFSNLAFQRHNIIILYFLLNNLLGESQPIEHIFFLQLRVTAVHLHIGVFTSHGHEIHLRVRCRGYVRKLIRVLRCVLEVHSVCGLANK